VTIGQLPFEGELNMFMIMYDVRARDRHLSFVSLTVLNIESYADMFNIKKVFIFWIIFCKRRPEALQ
jgi:hypothetical protein